MKYKDHYESNPEIRNFFIVMDAMKIFVDPSNNTIEDPAICATILTIFEPIIRRAGVFAQAIEPVFDPNDVVDCLVNEIYPAFLEKEGRELPERPKIPHIEPLDELPMDINRYDWTYRQILTWFYNHHENERLEIENVGELKSDMRDIIPMLKAVTIFAPLFDAHSTEDAIDILISNRIENEARMRAAWPRRDK